ncbi:ATP-binding protein [Paenibacillus solisilvae]|uniref:histidine kinase n=1 Tax=Paenibacillus solisilvae TaxID=2486751 RepID=A0ABW0VWB4_9BACL
MSILKDLLLQLSLIIVPVGIFQAYLLGHIRIKKHTNLFLAVLWGSSVLLCMSFPVSYGNGMYLDFRIVPLLIGTLYCGQRTGIFLAFLVGLYRLYLGMNPGFYNSLLAIICGFSVILYFQKTFAAASKSKRMKLAVILSSYYCIVGASLAGILRGVTTQSITIQIIHFGCAAGLTWLITALNENMAEIHTMRTELQNAERLRIIGNLTGVFAHEIRNPLQVTRGFLQLLNKTDLPDKEKRYIKLSIEELDHANHIIHDFLNMGKPTLDCSEDIDVGNQLGRAVNLIQNYALSKNVIIQTSIDGGCSIYGNAQKMEQFLINIMKNAIESMPSGGMMWVTCSSVDDSKVEIRVKDQGNGMSKQEVEQLGSPYYSLKESGTGLGMMVSFQIIRSFGGKLHVISEQNVGTEIIARIPKS